MAHILIIEDEKDISDLMSMQLRNKGHETTVIGDGDQALEYIQGHDSQSKAVDLFILDRMLPGASGPEICKFLRFYRPTKKLPILMVTALTRPEQIIEGLEVGADDYITKPFDMEILMARVMALLRRSELQKEKDNEENQNLLRLGELKVDTNQCKVWAKGQEIELTLSEYKLLCIFLQGPGKVFTRGQLVGHIQEGPVHVTDRTIDTHIFGLRKKLGEFGPLIETVRGIGYRVANNV